MITREKQHQRNKVNFTMPAQTVGGRETTTAEISPLVRAQSEIQETYSAHIEAQQVFEEAFEKMSQIDQVAIREVEKKFREYKIAVENTLARREEAEQEALDAYRQTVSRANEVYRDMMQRALRECQQNTKKASQQLSGIILSDYKVDHTRNPDFLPRITDKTRRLFRTVGVSLNRTCRQVKNRFRKAS